MQVSGIKTVVFGDVDFSVDTYWRVRLTKDDLHEIAEKRRYPDNRRLKRAKELYARDMRNGKWVVGNGETLKFNTEGQLIDGQNRVAGAILSGLDEVTFDIKTGIATSSISTIDSGVVRNDADVLTFNRITNATIVASISRCVQVIHNGATNFGSHIGINIAPTRTEVLEFALLNKDFLEKKASYSKSLSDVLKVKGFGPRGWFIAWWLTDCKSHEAADDFLEKTKAQKGNFVKMLVSMREVGPDGRARSVDWIVAQYLDYFNAHLGSDYVMGETSDDILKGYRKLLKEYIENARINDKYFKYLS